VRSEHGSETVRKLLEAAERTSVAFRIAAAVIVLAVTALADHLTGFEYSFASMYLLPIAIAAWFVGARTGRVFCLASVIIWFAVNSDAERGSSWQVTSWNIGLRLAMYLFVAMLVGTARDLLESERQRSRVDELTGVLNARAFYEVLSRELERARRSHRPLSVAYIDLDDFKAMNDRYGHAAGDELLRTFARCAKETVRTLDTVARLGGDEFAILLPETDGEGALGAIARFRERTSAIDGAPIGYSIGLITCDDDRPTSVDSVIQRADTLMYTAKRLGKNRHVHARFADALDVLPSRLTDSADKR
jgi:diguanylate cyclase (GGDEF)-like protein